MKIEFGYDRHIRSWNVVVIDDEGNIIESSYVGNMNDVKYEVNCLKSQYGIEEIVKIKAY